MSELAAMEQRLNQRLESLVGLLRPAAARSEAEAAAHAQGLLSYEDLQERLTIGRKNPRVPSMRWVKQLVSRKRAVIRPVELSGNMVGFREVSVRKLFEHLSGGADE